MTPCSSVQTAVNAGAVSTAETVGMYAGAFAGGATAGALNAAAYGGNVWQGALYGGLTAVAIVGLIQGAIELNNWANSQGLAKEGPLLKSPKSGAYYEVGNSGELVSIDWFESVTLKNFPSERLPEVKSAIQDVSGKLSECPSCAGQKAPRYLGLLKKATIVYNPNLPSTTFGWTPLKSFFFANEFQIGPAVFNNPAGCCSVPTNCLAATILHETAHLNWATHTVTPGLELSCFGCK